MNSIPLRVVLIASILLVAKVATGKAQADEQDLSATDSYEPPPASSCFDYFPGLLMMSRKIEHTVALLHCTISLDVKKRNNIEKKKKELIRIEISSYARSETVDSPADENLLIRISMRFLCVFKWILFAFFLSINLDSIFETEYIRVLRKGYLQLQFFSNRLLYFETESEL